MKLLKKLRKDQNGGGGQNTGRQLARHGKAQAGAVTDTNANSGTDLARRDGGRDLFGGFFDRLWNGRFLANPWSTFGDLTAGWGGFGMPGLFNSDLANWPAVDVAEDDKAVTMRVDLPGVDAKDIDVEVSGNSLTIRGSRNDKWTDDKAGVYRRERRFGSFSRTLPLPPYVDGDKVDARYENGMLTLHVPKVPGKGPRRVNVGA